MESVGIHYTDAWTRQFVPHPGKAHTMGGSDNDYVDAAPVLPLQAPSLAVEKDTLENGLRLLTLHCQPSAETVSVRLDLDNKDTAYNIWVDGRRADPASDKRHAYRWLAYRGVTSAGFDVAFELNPATSFGVDLTSGSMGLPALQGFSGYPPGIIPGPGDLSNTTVVGRHIYYPVASVYRVPAAERPPEVLKKH